MVALAVAVTPEVGAAIVIAGAARYCDPVAFIFTEVTLPKPLITATPSAVTPPGPDGAATVTIGGFVLVYPEPALVTDILLTSLNNSPR